MPDQNFDKKQNLVKGQNPTVAGTIERQYDPVGMIFGLVQVNDARAGNYGLQAGAYQTGLPDITDDPNEPNGDKKWSMQLVLDKEKRYFNTGLAFGFVLVQLRGGGFTGWIDEVDLTVT